VKRPKPKQSKVLLSARSSKELLVKHQLESTISQFKATTNKIAPSKKLNNSQLYQQTVSRNLLAKYTK